MATETIEIRIREDGSRVASRNIREIGDASKQSSSSLGVLKTLIATVVTSAALSKFVQLSDTYTQMQGQLALVTKGQENLNAVFNALVGVSDRTRTSLAANVELYSKLAVTAKDLGLSQRDIIGFTESLNQAIKISGATAIQAEAGIRQLSQALGSGALRGDELVSILENLPAVADVVAKSLNVSRGELKKLGEQGKLTSEVITTAFANAKTELADKFAKIPPTIGDGFQALSNQFLLTVGALDQVSGAGSSLGGFLKSMATTLKDLTPAFVNFGRAIFGTLDPLDELSSGAKVFATIFITIQSVLTIVAKTLVGSVVGAFKIVGNTIGGIAAAIGQLLQGNFANAGNIIKETFSNAASGIVDGLVDLGKSASAETTDAMEKIVQVWDKGSRQIQNRRKQIVGEVSEVRIKPIKAELIDQKAIESALRSLQALKASLNPIVAAQQEVAGAQKTVTDAVKLGLITTAEAIALQAQVAEKYRDTLNPLAAYNKELDAQFRLLRVSADKRAIESQFLEAEQSLRTKGITLTREESDAIRGKIAELEKLNRATQIQDELLANSVGKRQAFDEQAAGITKLKEDPNQTAFTQSDAATATSSLLTASGIDIQGTQVAADAQVAQLTEMYNQIGVLRQNNLISEQDAAMLRARANVQADEMRLANAQTFYGTLATLSKSGNSKLAAVGKAAAITQATIDGVLGVQKALASSPPPINFALAAAVGAVAAANVAQIAGLQFATGGQFNVGGRGGVDSQMVAFRASPGERVQVSTPTQVRKGDPSQGGQQAPAQQAPTNDVRIVNVLNPSLLEDYLNTAAGQRVLVNQIQRNNDAINGGR